MVEQRERWLDPQQTSEVSQPDSLNGKAARQTSEVSKTKRTLTALYNQRPTWLALAHEKLDRAVFAAYGWPSDLSDEDILARLLSLNLERSRK